MLFGPTSLETSAPTAARSRLVLALFAVAAIAAACSSSTSADATVSVSGTWTLSSVGGKSLPSTNNSAFTSGGLSYNNAQTYSGGSLVMGATSAQSVIVSTDLLTQGSTTISNVTTADTSSGSYTLNGSAITIILANTGKAAKTRTGTISGSTMNITSIDTNSFTFGSVTTNVVDTLVFSFTKSGS